MRILIYNWRDLAHPFSGGAEVYTDHVAREWVLRGHQVTLFCSAVDGQPEWDIAEGGYQVVRRGSRHGVYRAARQFWEDEGRGRFDLVVDEINTRPFGCPRWVRDTPVVGLIHQVAREVWFHEAPLPVAMLGRCWLEKHWLASYRDVRTVTVSESSLESLRHYGLLNVVAVPEGFEQPIDSSLTASKEAVPTFAFVGRLSPNKRPQDALRAFELVRRSVPEARLWVLGSGPLEHQLRKRAPQNVEFLGRVGESEKLDRMARAHALVVTSVREGWGLVVTEAASVGTPSIAYNVPGLRDSVAASGGILVGPSPRLIGERMVAEIPRLLAGALEVAPSGVTSWDRVADGLLAVALGGSAPTHSRFRQSLPVVAQSSAR